MKKETKQNKKAYATVKHWESSAPKNQVKAEFSDSKPSQRKGDKPISPVYSEIDTDLARDNLENDIPNADLQDL